MDAHRRYAISRVDARTIVSNEQKRMRLGQEDRVQEKTLQVKTVQRLRVEWEIRLEEVKMWTTKACWRGERDAACLQSFQEARECRWRRWWVSQAAGPRRRAYGVAALGFEPTRS